MKVFSTVYCDRVYFLCAERFETGSGFDFPPPPLAAPPYPVERWVPPPPPPPPGAYLIATHIWDDLQAQRTRVRIILSFFFRVHHPWTESYVWPGSCTVGGLLISSRQIFQAAFIFKKWASQQVLHGLLWGPAFTCCICCISIASFTQVGIAAAHTRAESVEGLPQLPLRFMARC